MQRFALFILLAILLGNFPITAQVTVSLGPHIGAGSTNVLLPVPHRPQESMSHEKSLAHHHAIRQLAHTNIQTDTTVLLLDSAHMSFMMSINDTAFHWYALLYSNRANLENYYFYSTAYIGANFYKSVYDYLPNDSLSSILDYRQTITDYPSSTAFEYTFQGPTGYSDFYFYNANGYLQEHLIQFQQEDTRRNLYGYNQNNKLTSWLFQKPSSTPNIWEDLEKELYFRDAMDRDTTVVTYGKHLNEFNVFKNGIVRKFYDQNNRVEKELIYTVAIPDSNDVSLSEIRTYTYDHFGNVSQLILESILRYPSYTDTFYIVYDYYFRCDDALDSLIWYCGYASQQNILFKARDLYFFSTKPCFPDSLYKQNWDTATNSFLSTSKYLFDYDSYGNLTGETQFSSNNEEWNWNKTIILFYGWHLIDISGVDDPATNNLIQPLHVYPNPTSGLLRLDVPLGDPFAVQVYNTMGQRIEEFNNRYNPELDLSAYPTGMYLIRVIQNSSIYQQKVLKQ